jgi:hypothetical protein
MQQIALKLSAIEIDGLSSFLGMTQENDFMAPHQRILELHHFGTLNLQVSYETDIWTLAA